MRDASSYRGARRNAIRPIWEWIGPGPKDRRLVKPREPWVPNQTPIKRRTTYLVGKSYPAGWRTADERGDRAILQLAGAA